jgi:hypothetical protein
LVFGLIIVPLAQSAAAVPTLTVSATTNLMANQVVNWSVTGVTPNVLSSIIECNGDPNEPTMSLLGNNVPVGCTPVQLKSTTATGTASGTFTIKVGTVGPPSSTGNDSNGNPGSVDAPLYPCPPTQAQVNAGVTCVIAFGTTAGVVDQTFVPIHFQGEPTTTTSSSTSTTSTSTSTTSTSTTTSSTTTSTTTTSTTVPGGGPTVTVIGTCSGQSAIGKIKDVATGTHGLTNISENDKISLKAVTGGEGTCNLGAGPVTPDPGSFKASFTGFASCDNTATPGGLAPSGKVSLSFAGGTVKLQSYARITSPPDPVHSPDVVGVHGIVVKGSIAGADVDGSVWEDPTFKDATNTSGLFAKYDVNPLDMAAIAASCTSGTSTGNLAFTDGSGGKKPTAVPTNIETVLSGDGQSPLGAALGFTPLASGLTFSVY